MAHSYEDHSHDPSPYASGDGFYNQSSGYYPPQPKKKGVSNWVKIGIPVLVLVIAGAVAGAVVAVRAKNNATTSSSAGGGSGGGASGGSGAPGNNGIFATATNTNSWPVYPAATNAAAFTVPSFAVDAVTQWPADPQAFDDPTSFTTLRNHPRIIAPSYKWDALPQLIKSDPYMKFWDSQIMAFAAQEYAAPPIAYDIDGGLDKSGVLDPARNTKRRIKALCYAYRMTKDTKWIDRTWRELQNASNNGTTPFGTPPDIWNTAHFLDLAEFTNAFAIAYDWLYDVWTDDQKDKIKWSIINYGLNYGLQVHTAATTPGYGWWKTGVNGNWNCVCNGGMILGSLAIMEDDTTGTAAKLLPLATANAAANCALGPSSDGTWSETANYWYFGTTGYAELTSALMTATGGDHNMLNTNPGFALTGLYHMHVSGMTAMFNYGDHGPNKFSTTANSMLFMGSAFKNPAYTLFQRDRSDSPEPWSMFWYDPSVKGAWWDTLALDHYFDDPSDTWVSMRSSWTDNNGLALAMKAGGLQKHQTHGDLDAGDFVIDALGVRWAGEYGSADYLGDGYFSNEDQDSVRWLWYRKMTEGQNTIAVNGANQLVTYKPGNPTYQSSETVQGSSTVMDVPSDSTAFFTVDLSSAYAAGTSFKRGIRMINGRRQILIQDEITATAGLQWRMQTNATITPNGASATLTLEDKTMQVQILNPPAGAAFTRSDPVRTAKAPQLQPNQEADQPNPGVSVLIIDLPAGTYNLQVLFNPQWDNFNSFQTPPSVALSDWSLTSHNA